VGDDFIIIYSRNLSFGRRDLHDVTRQANQHNANFTDAYFLSLAAMEPRAVDPAVVLTAYFKREQTK
jgi:hypothetical protein